MFENAPENLPVDDIFDKVEPSAAPPARGGGQPQGVAPSAGAARPSPLKPVQRPAVPPAPADLAALEEPGMGYQRILLFVGIGIVIVGVIGAAVFFTLRRVATPATNVPVANVNAPAANTNANVPVITPPPAPPW